jgi:hypothetical protein
LGTFALAAATSVSACLKSLEPPPSSLHLDGSWSYTGTQTNPVPETLTGTLTISSESGSSFAGSLDVTVTAQDGQTRRLLGIVSGARKGADLIDFDANLDANPRRHVGQILADTVEGSWVASSTDGPVASGAFRMERQAH